MGRADGHGEVMVLIPKEITSFLNTVQHWENVPLPSCTRHDSNGIKLNFKNYMVWCFTVMDGWFVVFIRFVTRGFGSSMQEDSSMRDKKAMEENRNICY
jgi:hypothetical protein